MMSTNHYEDLSVDDDDDEHGWPSRYKFVFIDVYVDTVPMERERETAMPLKHICACYPFVVGEELLLLSILLFFAYVSSRCAYGSVIILVRLCRIGIS